MFASKVGALRLLFGGGRLGEIIGGWRPSVRRARGHQAVRERLLRHLARVDAARERVDTVVVVGVAPAGCVRATAVDALQHGFIPLVVREAVGDRDLEAHDANLRDLQAKYAEVLDEATVIDYLGEGRVHGGD